jgi:hypothetical protein
MMKDKEATEDKDHTPEKEEGEEDRREGDHGGEIGSHREDKED